jgi:hypothetical protein
VLVVEPEGDRAFPLEHVALVPAQARPFVRPGSIFRVRLDPSRTSNLMIDWGAV